MMNRQLKILVTGATGAVGPVVVNELLNAGHRIRTLSLEYAPDGTWPEGVEQITGDITDQLTVLAAMKDMDAVVHLAALLHIVNPPEALKELYEKVNVGGTINVVKAGTACNIKRIVLFSTIAVYGSSDGTLLTENSPVNPESFYAHTKLAAEMIILEAKNKEGGPIGTVLRLGAVYGPRIKGNYHRLIKALAKNVFLGVGNGENRRTIVYDKDVAKAAAVALEYPSAAGKVYNISDGTPHKMNEIITAICLAMGKSKPGLALPVKPIRFLAGLMEDLSGKLGFNSPINRTAIDKYVEDIAVDSSLIQSELNFRPGYGLFEGWKETIELMKTNGEL